MTRVDKLMMLIDEGRLLLEAAATTSDWKTFIAQEAYFRQRLEKLMAEPIMPVEAEAVRIALQELLAINNQAVELVEERQMSIASGLQRASHVRRAARAYSDTVTV